MLDAALRRRARPAVRPHPHPLGLDRPGPRAPTAARAAEWLAAPTCASLGAEASLRPTAGPADGRRPSARPRRRAACAVLRPLRRPARGDPLRPLGPCRRSSPSLDPQPDGETWIRGRGASDDKGALMTFVEAVRAWRADPRHAAVRVSFLFEGEEESGSRSRWPRSSPRRRPNWPATRSWSATATSGTPRPRRSPTHDPRHLRPGDDHHLRRPRPAFRHLRQCRPQRAGADRRRSSPRCAPPMAASPSTASTTASQSCRAEIRAALVAAAVRRREVPRRCRAVACRRARPTARWWSRSGPGRPARSTGSGAATWSPASRP